jgi:hypothetical protein
VPESRRTSCNLLILVDEAAEAIASLDLVDLGWCAAGERSRGSSLPQVAVRPMVVVVAFELSWHCYGMTSINDQETIEQFAADRPDEALGDRIRPWCAHRRLDDLDVDSGEDGVEGGGDR